DGNTKVVSERFISRATPTISTVDRPVALGNTASGFPVSGVSVKTSTRQKSKNRSAILGDLGPRGWGCALLSVARQVFLHAPTFRRGGHRSRRRARPSERTSRSETDGSPIACRNSRS